MRWFAPCKEEGDSRSKLSGLLFAVWGEGRETHRETNPEPCMRGSIETDPCPHTATM